MTATYGKSFFFFLILWKFLICEIRSGIWRIKHPNYKFILKFLEQTSFTRLYLCSKFLHKITAIWKQLFASFSSVVDAFSVDVPQPCYLTQSECLCFYILPPLLYGAHPTTTINCLPRTPSILVGIPGLQGHSDLVEWPSSMHYNTRIVEMMEMIWLWLASCWILLL